jgi:DNA repair exonuclease SbcCD ATPase subunit
MNNNIYKNNKIIEQKDELIKQLREKKEIPNSQININMSNQPNNNEIILLKFENEKLKNEIASLKSSRKGNTNNLLTNNISPSLYGNNNQDSQKLNINLMNENKTLKTKITQLEENIKLLTSKNEEQKNTIKNLEIQLDKKQEEIAGLHDFIVKLQSKLENEDFIIQKSNVGKTSKSQMDIKNQTDQNIAEKMKNYLDLLNKANNDISALQKKNKELQFKLEEKQLEEDLSGFRTEEVNFSNYEEEFDLKKMVNGARDKNRSEDINIDYPGMQGVKEKYKDLQQNMNMLEEQVKILISNINCNNNKIKPQISQICQIMRIPAKNIPLIIAGKNKKKSLGLID